MCLCVYVCTFDKGGARRGVELGPAGEKGDLEGSTRMRQKGGGGRGGLAQHINLKRYYRVTRAHESDTTI